MAPKKKPKELKRRNNITVKLTDIELELLNQKAEMAGTSKAGYLRNLLIGTPMKVRYAGSPKADRRIRENRIES